MRVWCQWESHLHWNRNSWVTSAGTQAPLQIFPQFSCFSHTPNEWESSIKVGHQNAGNEPQQVGFSHRCSVKSRWGSAQIADVASGVFPQASTYIHSLRGVFSKQFHLRFLVELNFYGVEKKNWNWEKIKSWTYCIFWVFRLFTLFSVC